MRRSLLLLLLLSPLLVAAQLNSRADSLWFVTNYTKKETYIPMRDGVRLFTAIYTPKDRSEKHPILMMRTPYSLQPYGPKEFTKAWSGIIWRISGKNTFLCCRTCAAPG